LGSFHFIFKKPSPNHVTLLLRNKNLSLETCRVLKSGGRLGLFRDWKNMELTEEGGNSKIETRIPSTPPEIECMEACAGSGIRIQTRPIGSFRA
jgi:hypothetical protein